METFKSGKIHLYETKLDRRLCRHVLKKRDKNTFTICHMSIVYFSRPCLLYALDIILIFQLASQEKASENVCIDVNQVKHCAS